MSWVVLPMLVLLIGRVINRRGGHRRDARRVVLIVWSIAAAAVFIGAARGMEWHDLLVVAAAVAYVYGARVAFRSFVWWFCASDRRAGMDEPDYALAAALGVIVAAMWPLVPFLQWASRLLGVALEAAGRRHGGGR